MIRRFNTQKEERRYSFNSINLSDSNIRLQEQIIISSLIFQNSMANMDREEDSTIHGKLKLVKRYFRDAEI